MNAIIYLRWSTLEQGHSDRSSEIRQDAATKAFCAMKGWLITERLLDKGRSAYTGANLTKGNLGDFTRRVLSGAIDARDTVLVVEELDRLSRQSPGVMTAWLTPLLEMGLTIAIANSGQIVTSHMMNNDFGGFVTLMSSAFAAHAFSLQQSRRGNASWKKRRDAASEGKVLSRHRARGWLTWDDATKAYLVIEERAKLVDEMFALRLSGWGKAGIAKLFNRRAPSDGRYAVFSSSKVAPAKWTSSAIARIVQDRAVTGYLQYNQFPRGAEERVPIGDPVLVYPPIIAEDIFARANDARLDQQLKTQGRGRAVSNLLGPLARCGACGGTMQPLGSSRIIQNKNGTTSQHYPIYCMTAKATGGKQCDNQRGWPYRNIEGPIIDRLLSLAIDDQHFRQAEASDLQGEVIKLQRRIIDQKASKTRILNIIASSDDEEAQDAYKRATARLDATKAELVEAHAALDSAKGAVTPQQHIVRVAEIRGRIKSEDTEERYQARSLVKAAMRDIIEKIEFDPTDGKVSVHLTAGLGLMWIHADGRIGHFDLHHRARDHSKTRTGNEAEAILGFMRRNAA